jgi:PAS domain S-box-containing protein
MDITSLRKTEQRLLEMNREMEHIFESINDSFIALDHDFNFTYINREAERVYNVKREDLLHRNIWVCYPKGKELKFYEQLNHAMTQQVSVHFEEYSPTADLWVSVNAYPTQNGLAIYFSDVTEQRKLQDQIINEEQKLRAIINNTRDIIWSMDRNMQVISANQAYYDRVAQMTNNKPYETLTADDFEAARYARWRAYFDRAFSGETFYVVEQEEQDGEVFFEEISFNPIYDKDNYIFGVSCFSRNITEQHRQMERIQKQNERLTEIAWLQSHQVRGPVATILGLIPLFNYEDPADKGNIEILDMIRTTAHQLDQNIKEVVNKARVV